MTVTSLRNFLLCKLHSQLFWPSIIQLHKAWNDDLSEATIRPTEFPALLDGWVTNTPSVKVLFPQKKTACSIIFLKTPHLDFVLLRIWQVFSVSCKTVYWWVIPVQLVLSCLQIKLKPSITRARLYFKDCLVLVFSMCKHFTGL